jgi:hypothetical protein
MPLLDRGQPHRLPVPGVARKITSSRRSMASLAKGARTATLGVMKQPFETGVGVGVVIGVILVIVAAVVYFVKRKP